MGLERFDRKCIVSRDKDYERQLLGCQCFEDFEPADARHLHVEKNEVGTMFFDRSNGMEAVGRFIDDDEIRRCLEELANELSSQRLVVNDERANFQLEPPFAGWDRPVHRGSGGQIHSPSAVEKEWRY